MAVGVDWRDPLLLGQQASSPVCLEHEKNENFHGEWTSVIFACPESVLPPPDHSTSFSLQQVTPSLLSFGANPGFLAPGISD